MEAHTSTDELTHAACILSEMEKNQLNCYQDNQDHHPGGGTTSLLQEAFECIEECCKMLYPSPRCFFIKEQRRRFETLLHRATSIVGSCSEPATFLIPVCVQARRKDNQPPNAFFTTTALPGASVHDVVGHLDDGRRNANHVLEPSPVWHCDQKIKHTHDTSLFQLLWDRLQRDPSIPIDDPLVLEVDPRPPHSSRARFGTVAESACRSQFQGKACKQKRRISSL